MLKLRSEDELVAALLVDSTTPLEIHYQSGYVYNTASDKIAITGKGALGNQPMKNEKIKTMMRLA
jgi:hypothetical protein